MARVQAHLLNTPDMVREYLREALDIVDELGPPDDLREQVFLCAANLISAKTPVVEQDVQARMIPESLLRPAG